jgi:hypothetical protein
LKYPKFNLDASVTSVIYIGATFQRDKTAVFPVLFISPQKDIPNVKIQNRDEYKCSKKLTKRYTINERIT